MSLLGARKRPIRDKVLDQLPGADELRLMCANARRVQKLCDMLGIEGDPHPPSPSRHHGPEDDVGHYIWDD